MWMVLVGTSLGVLAAKVWGQYRQSSDALRVVVDAAHLPFKQVVATRNTDKVVIIRGKVAHPSVKTPYDLFTTDAHIVHQRIQKIRLHDGDCVIGMLRWALQLFGLLNNNNNNNIYSFSYRMFPFQLLDNPPSNPRIWVELDGSSQPLPLTTARRQLHTLQTFSSPFLHALFGKTTMLDEVKVLSPGKIVTVIGKCSKRNDSWKIYINSSDKLPYFVSEMTKSEMVADLTTTTNMLLRNAVLVGSVSLGLLGYSVVRLGVSNGQLTDTVEEDEKHVIERSSVAYEFLVDDKKNRRWWRWEESTQGKQHTHESNEVAITTDVDGHESNELARTEVDAHTIDMDTIQTF